MVSMGWIPRWASERDHQIKKSCPSREELGVTTIGAEASGEAGWLRHIVPPPANHQLATAPCAPTGHSERCVVTKHGQLKHCRARSHYTAAYLTHGAADAPSYPWPPLHAGQRSQGSFERKGSSVRFPIEMPSPV